MPYNLQFVYFILYFFYQFTAFLFSLHLYSSFIILAEKCSIRVNTITRSPLPDRTPTWLVNITNQCEWRCAISKIHVRCGSLSCVTPIDPTVFKRLRYNDCLVNNDNRLAFGATMSFSYAKKWQYSFPVSSASCPR